MTVIDEEIRRYVDEAVRREVERRLSEDLGCMAAEAINERRRSQGKPDLEL